MLFPIIILIGVLLNLLVVGMSLLNIVYIVVSIVLVVINVPKVKAFIKPRVYKNRWLNGHNYIYATVVVVVIIFGLFSNPNKDEKDYFNALDAANAAMEKDQHNKTEQICNDLLLEDPEDVNVLLLLGISYLDKEELKASYDYLIKAYKIAPYNADILYNLAINRYMYASEADLPKIKNEAIYYYSELIELHPRILKPYIHISEMALELKNYRLSKYHLDYAYRLEPDNPLVLYTLAKYHFQLIEYEEAGRVIDQALEMKLPKEQIEAFEDLSNQIETKLKGGI